MPYGECKVYSDGSHYIAIPHIPRRCKPRKKLDNEKITVKEQYDAAEETVRQIAMDSVFPKTGSTLIPLTAKEEWEVEEFTEYVNIHFLSAKPQTNTERKMTRREFFDDLYADSVNLKKSERRASLISTMRQYFESEKQTRDFVDENLERKRRNLICRRIRLTRKANLQNFNYFCTFTFDDKKHTEESFRKKLKNCLSLFSSRKGWKYIGVWERSPEKKRLHFHGVFDIPDGTMPGKMQEVNDYSFRTHKRQITVQNTYFNERFGRSDFSRLYKDDIGSALAYLMKYMGKTEEKIVYSKGLQQYFISDIMDEDVVCNIGLGDRKLLLYDDFNCWDEGCLIGTVSKDVIKQLRKTNE